MDCVGLVPSVCQEPGIARRARRGGRHLRQKKIKKKVSAPVQLLYRKPLWLLYRGVMYTKKTNI